MSKSKHKMMQAMQNNKSITSISQITEEFEKNLESFDYKLFTEMTSVRSLNAAGFVKASELLIEITRVSALFVGEKILSSIDEFSACVSAYWGWKLEHDFFSRELSNNTMSRVLTKIATPVYKEYRSCGLPISLSDTAELIYCCALIKNKFYKEFSYDLYGIHLQDNTINVIANYTSNV